MPSKKETIAPKAVRGPYRMDERLKLVKAAREMGAIKIEVDGLTIEFPCGLPDYPITVDPDKWRLKPQVPPNLEYLAKSGESRAETPEPVPEPPIAGGPHPDEFSRQSDIWANYSPLGR